MGVGTNAWPETTAGNVGRKSNGSRDERSSQGWLAVGAVAVEPFSAGQFPANGEKTGKIRQMSDDVIYIT